MTTTPALWQFAGAYLHQDWPEESGDVWTALSAFVSDEPELAARLPGEIALVLDQYPSEEGLGRYIETQGACLVPPPEDGGYRGWLEEVARRASADVS